MFKKIAIKKYVIPADSIDTWKLTEITKPLLEKFFLDYVYLRKFKIKANRQINQKR